MPRIDIRARAAKQSSHMSVPTSSDVTAPRPYVIVAGYGLPGRSLVELLVRRKIDYVVIELNAQACERAAAGGINIIAGSASDPDILHRAGVERATLVALMVPSDEIVLAAVSYIRKRNPKAYMIARCAYTSTGLEAQRRGADQSIVAEQVIARELEEIVGQHFPTQIP
jgi:voltage-gated potassium channel Kch